MRLFAAVWPSEQVGEALGELRGHGLSSASPQGDVRWTRPETWHVTLRFYGSVTTDQLHSLIDGVADAVTSSSRLEVCGGPATAMLGGHALVVPIEGLDLLAATVRAVCPEIGESAQQSGFRGHLTLARAKSATSLRGLVEIPVKFEWSVHEVTLVESTTRHDGPEYRIVERFALHAE